jgi:hypothetical protein
MLSVITLIAVMLSVVTLIAVMQSVIMPEVTAPCSKVVKIKFECKLLSFLSSGFFTFSKLPAPKCTQQNSNRHTKPSPIFQV